MKLEVANPAPLGLLAFATTTSLLMYVDMEWVEPEFKELVWGYAVWYGGMAQLIVGLFEIIKGNTFGATAFSTYGCFWLGWATMWHAYKTEESFVGASAWLHGETLWFATFGVITFVFWIITLKKNLCLVVVFGLLAATFFLLVFGVFNEDIKRIAGYVGFATAISAAYTAFAELFAHEWGLQMPGLQPMFQSTKTLTKELLEKRLQYDKRSNTLLMDLRDISVSSIEDVETIRVGIKEKATAAERKVNAVVNYHGFTITPDLQDVYRVMVLGLQKDYYQTVTRLSTDIFAEKAEVPAYFGFGGSAQDAGVGHLFQQDAGAGHLFQAQDAQPAGAQLFQQQGGAGVAGQVFQEKAVPSVVKALQ